MWRSPLAAGVSEFLCNLTRTSMCPLPPHDLVEHRAVHEISPTRMRLALSSGTARQPTDPGFASPGGFDKGYTSGSAPGFPKDNPACPGVSSGTPNDGVALEVKVRVPTNAIGFAYDAKYYTYEWPVYVCTAYNDFSFTDLTPTPAGQSDGNIVFDSSGSPVNASSTLIDVCTCSGAPPCTAGGSRSSARSELQSSPARDSAPTRRAATTARRPGSRTPLQSRAERRSRSDSASTTPGITFSTRPCSSTISTGSSKRRPTLRRRPKNRRCPEPNQKPGDTFALAKSLARSTSRFASPNEPAGRYAVQKLVGIGAGVDTAFGHALVRRREVMLRPSSERPRTRKPRPSAASAPQTSCLQKACATRPPPIKTKIHPSSTSPA